MLGRCHTVDPCGVWCTRSHTAGPWLPEPVLTAPDVAEDVVRTDDVSTAMLVVLETLSPVERTVFVLREVFGLSVAEVAQVVERSEAAVRQLAHRAREHVRARRPRYDTDRAQHRAVTAAFLDACRRGDLDALVSLLDPDIRLVSDGVGLASAARRPVVGAGPVARFLLGLARRYEGIEVVSCELNGEPGLVLVADGEPISWACATAESGISGRCATPRSWPRCRPPDRWWSKHCARGLGGGELLPAAPHPPTPPSAQPASSTSSSNPATSIATTSTTPAATGPPPRLPTEKRPFSSSRLIAR